MLKDSFDRNVLSVKHTKEAVEKRSQCTSYSQTTYAKFVDSQPAHGITCLKYHRYIGRNSVSNLLLDTFVRHTYISTTGQTRFVSLRKFHVKLYCTLVEGTPIRF